MTDGRDRRDVLRAGAALCSLGLAGCVNDGGGGGDDGNGTPSNSNSSDGTAPGEEPPEPEPVTSWPQQQYDARNTAAVPNATAPTEDVEELWRLDLGEQVRSSPVVADGVVYVRDTGGTVHAIDADGDEQWTASVPNGELLTTPAIYEDLLLVPHDAGVIAFDRSDGDEEWRYASEEGTTDLTVADGAVFFANTQGGVYAVEAGTGEPRWEVLQNTAQGYYRHPPAVDDGTLYVPQTASGETDFLEISAIDVETDEKRSIFRTEEYSASAGLSIADGRIFAPTPGGIRAFDREGNELWNFPTDKPVETGIAICGNILAGISIENAEATLYAISANTGDKQWEISFRADVNTVPVLVGTSVIVGTLDKGILAYSGSTGEEDWIVDAPITTFHQGTFSDRQFYFAGWNGRLFAYGKP